jgi:hypothetical protein
MDKVDKLFYYSDSEPNFRAICEIDDFDPDLIKKDIVKNLDILIEIAKNFNNPKYSQEENENAGFSQLGYWIIKHGVSIGEPLKELIIKKAIIPNYEIPIKYKTYYYKDDSTKIPGFRSVQYEYPKERYSISDIMKSYHKGVLDSKFKGFKTDRYIKEPEEEMRKAINKFNYHKNEPISKEVFEENIAKMINGRFDDECMLIFANLQLKCGAKMEEYVFNLIMKGFDSRMNYIDSMREFEKFDEHFGEEVEILEYFKNEIINYYNAQNC